MAQVLSKEIAEQDVHQWLDFLRTPKEAREKETIKQVIARLTEAVQEGILVFNEDHTITHNLIVALGDGATKKLTYKSRFAIGDLYEALKGVGDDGFLRVFTILSLISGEGVAVIKKLSREDYAIAEKLTLFF